MSAILDLPDSRDKVFELTGKVPRPPSKSYSQEFTIEGGFPTTHTQRYDYYTCPVFATIHLVEHRIKTTYNVIRRLSPTMASFATVNRINPRKNGVNTSLAGVSFRDALETTRKIGVCEHKYWDDEADPVEPHALCWNYTYKIGQYSAVRPGTGFTLDSWFELLLNMENPIGVVTYTTTDWYTTGVDGVCGSASSGSYGDRDWLLPFDPDTKRDLHGIVICGFKPGYWRIKNSWSKWWGDHGCVWMPRDYPLYDAWAVSTISFP